MPPQRRMRTLSVGGAARIMAAALPAALDRGLLSEVTPRLAQVVFALKLWRCIHSAHLLRSPSQVLLECETCAFTPLLHVIVDCLANEATNQFVLPEAAQPLCHMLHATLAAAAAAAVTYATAAAWAGVARGGVERGGVERGSSGVVAESGAWVGPSVAWRRAWAASHALLSTPSARIALAALAGILHSSGACALVVPGTPLAPIAKRDVSLIILCECALAPRWPG